MSVAPHSGIVDFGTFTPPSAPLNGIQGEVPAPLLVESGYLLSTSGWVPAASGLGTVTSVAATVPSVLSITGSPITTSGTLAIGYSGTALPIANGGTGATTAPAGITNLRGWETTVTAGGTTTLTNASATQQNFTGSTTQTVVLPVTSTLALGWAFEIINNGTGTITVNSSGGNTVGTVVAGTTASIVCSLTSGTTAASWDFDIDGFATETGTGAVVRATSASLSSPTFSTPQATGQLAFSGSTSSSAQFATSQTTGNTTICTIQTSGTLIVGGTSGTGTQTIGRSTVSQTTNIQAGATASGSTKTMNIGTEGLSGSTTNIAIGSAVSGATSRTTLNGIVIDSISAAVSAAGTTQGTATGLVSNVNNVTVVAVSADGVRLPTAVAGMRILVRNSDSADTLSIYPATGGTINALSANAAFTLAAGSTTELMATTATQWYTF